MPIAQAPIGRMTKPTAKIAAVCSNCAVWSPFGKKLLAKDSANAKETTQSNHSTRLPADPPIMLVSLLLSRIRAGPLRSPAAIDRIKQESDRLGGKEEQLRTVRQADEQVEAPQDADRGDQRSRGRAELALGVGFSAAKHEHRGAD